jgi:hypothetical protein
MAHPMKSQAHSASRDKFKAITGHSGGGHAYGGSSHLKKAGSDGSRKTWSGQRKTHILDDFKACGGKAKARADRRARGGRKGGEEIDSSKLDPRPGPNSKKPTATHLGRRNDFPSMIAGPEETKGWFDKLSGRDTTGKSGFSPQDLMGMKRGLKRGGRALGGVKNADDWGDEDSTRQTIPVKGKPTRKYEPPQKEDWGMAEKHGPPQYEDWGMHPASGRKKYARGGKAPGKVIINVNAAQSRPAAPPPRPPMPPPMPPGAGAGPPPAPPPTGGMPPPGGGGPPGGGANPMAAIGKGMGFARGGKAGPQHPNPNGGPKGGDTKYDLAGWRKYAANDRHRRLSGKSGMTQGYTKRIGDDGSLDVEPVKPGKRASGGRMTAGAFSGEGRLEKAAIARRGR